MPHGIFELEISGNISEIGIWSAGRGQTKDPLPGMRIAISGTPGEKFESDVKYTTVSEVSADPEHNGSFFLTMKISGSERMLYIYSMNQDYAIIDFVLAIDDVDYENATSHPKYTGLIKKSFDVRVMKLRTAKRIKGHAMALVRDESELLLSSHLSGHMIGVSKDGSTRSLPIQAAIDLGNEYSFVNPSLLFPRRLQALERIDVLVDRETSKQKVALDELELGINSVSGLLDEAEKHLQKITVNRPERVSNTFASHNFKDWKISKLNDGTDSSLEQKKEEQVASVLARIRELKKFVSRLIW